MAGLACTSAISRSVSALPVALPPAWTIRRQAVPALQRQRQAPVRLGVEAHAAGDQLLDRSGRLADERLDRRRAAQTPARRERVLGVALRGVGCGQRRRQPALRPETGALPHRLLETLARHEHNLSAGLAGAQRRVHPGGAGADDHQILLSPTLTHA